MKVSINESTLTAIGNAIRAKTGKSDLIAPGAMPEEIEAIETGGGGGGIEVEPIVLTGDCSNACSGAMAGAYIDLFGDTISTKDVKSTSNMFNGYQNEKIPFDINCDGGQYSMSSMFRNAINLKELPKINNAYPKALDYMFCDCHNLRIIPEDFFDTWNLSLLSTDSNIRSSFVFSRCYSLRKIPATLLTHLSGIQTSSTYVFVNNMCPYCYTLDELINVPVHPVTMTSNMFMVSFTDCARLKNLTFEVNEDGTPKTANWKNQTILLNSGVGYNRSNTTTQPITGFNSGITEDKQVIDDATYQALKDDPDWFTNKYAYSRYNHNSAVATINSLPDTSAYLATAGGTNTIRFHGASGSSTDGGAISTLTEEEIAVATAKGWTVSF